MFSIYSHNEQNECSIEYRYLKKPIYTSHRPSQEPESQKMGIPPDAELPNPTANTDFGTGTTVLYANEDLQPPAAGENGQRRLIVIRDLNI